LVDVAMADTCHRTNPRPCTRADFERMFADALEARDAATTSC
jgi:hypothetical protein